MCVRWINRGERFGSIADHRNHPAARFDLIAKRLQKDLAYESHVDGQREQVVRLNLSERCTQTAHRTARGRIVRYELHIGRSPRWIGSPCYQNLRTVPLAQ